MSFRKTVSRISRGPLAPLAASFAGVGGILFHAGHGPEHLLCMLLGAVVAVGGTLWGIINSIRLRRSPWREVEGS